MSLDVQYSEGRKEQNVNHKSPKLAALLDSTVRVTVTDGRILEGYLWCVDGMKNIILLSTIERAFLDEESEREAIEAEAKAIEEMSAGQGADSLSKLQLNDIRRAKLAKMTERNVSLIMVPGPHIVKFEVLESVARKVLEGKNANPWGTLSGGLMQKMAEVQAVSTRTTGVI
ncbi:unnamed protein product [Amoebophrya sp. A120]|nr:unnamed protein product [Amoebophrya sp. A120]|eukprot:GSA120T00024092001.1